MSADSPPPDRTLKYLLILLRALSRTQAGDAVMAEILERFGDRDEKTKPELTGRNDGQE